MTSRALTPALIAAIVFAVALAVRIGSGSIPPFDDLYHLKRIEWSAAQWPRTLDFDDDRGDGGAFCPWPPLYDVSAAAIDRAFGGVSWLPPLFFSCFAALASLAVWRATSSATRDLRPAASAAVAGLTIALSPYLIGISARGHIDHHYVEPLLLLLIVYATAARRGILLGFVIAAALMVQTALLVAAAIAFAVLLKERRSGGPRSIAPAIGFVIAATAVLLWRMTRAPGYPDSAWYLGYPHAAALGGAAVALALTRVTSRAIALAAGAIAALAVPSFAPAFFGGIGFFRGDPWLRTILEFQPMFNRPEQIGTDLANLTGGALLCLMLFRRHGTFSIFAAAYLLLALASRRFLVPAIPLFAIAGALTVVHVRRKALALAAAALTLLPPLAYDMYAGIAPSDHVEVARFAQRFRDLPPGRVLAPWSYGHAIDVIGRHPVLVDNFGSMPDAALFASANDALRLTRADVFLEWCRAHAVRYVVLNGPRGGLRSSAAVLGLDPALYDGTPLAMRTVWWRLYHAGAMDPAFRQVLRHGELQVWEVGSR